MKLTQTRDIIQLELTSAELEAIDRFMRANGVGYNEGRKVVTEWRRAREKFQKGNK